MPADAASRAELVRLAPEEVFSALDSMADGLTEAEAGSRLSHYGPNTIERVGREPLWRRAIPNFTHVMAMLLWVAGGIAWVSGTQSLAIAIWLVNVINGVFSTWQEHQAERAAEALERLMPIYARVVREGKEHRISAAELVPGDVVLLSEGDRVSADLRLVEAIAISADESLLTGESRPVAKSASPLRPLAAEPPVHSNLMFAGTSVLRGSGKAVAFATAGRTELGKIAQLTQNVAPSISPLQREMARTARIISGLALSAGGVLFLLAYGFNGIGLIPSFIFALGMIVALVPEGLVPTVTVALAMASKRLARRQALVKRLANIETIGCTTVICTDKTGTLTENEMTVTRLWTTEGLWQVTGDGYCPEGEIIPQGEVPAVRTTLDALMRVGALCNNAKLLPPTSECHYWHIVGDPTEAALLVAAKKHGLTPTILLHTHPRLREIPFDSVRKRMTTIHLEEGRNVAYMKGAPESLIDLCGWIQHGNHVLPLDAKARAEALSANDSLASQGQRVLAFAYRILPDGFHLDPEAIEGDMVFVGLVAMTDPIRAGVADAIARCQTAGIRVIMVTGDQALTAQGVAKQVGLLDHMPPRYLGHADIESMDLQALGEVLTTNVVLSRVTPEQKLKIVEALQVSGHVVAMTGDGVNDAPALKRADVGVAMGLKGTDVAREAADLVLLDDHFATIVNAIEEGRAVYDNIRRFATYVFTSNMPEAVPFALMLLSQGAVPLPLTVMQVLAIDLGTDMVPAIGLGAEQPEDGAMQRPPRDRRQPLLTRGLLAKAFLWFGLLEVLASLAAYFYVNMRMGWPSLPLAPVGSHTYRLATTMMFATIVSTQIGAVFACRTDRMSVFKLGLFSNRLIMAGIVVEIALLLIVVYTPGLQAIFNTAPMSLTDWIFPILAAPLVLVAEEIRKALLNWRKR